MFCKKCGTEIPQDSAFCPNCGERVQVETQAPVDPAVTSNAAPETTAPTAAQAPASQGITISKKTVMIAVAVLAILLVVVAIVKNHRIAINLNDYVEVDFEGYDTKGKAKYSFDYDKLEKDYGSKLELTSSPDKEIKKEVTDLKSLNKAFADDDYSDAAVVEVMEELFSADLDKYDELSNGDTVMLNWDVEKEKIEKSFKCRVKYKDTEYTVEGLEEAEKFDPFDGIEVTFDGVAPNGRVDIQRTTEKEPYSYLNYSADVRDGLNNGDKVTVSISGSYQSNDVDDYCIEHFGVIPTQTSKEYVVDGLAKYVTNAAEISDTALNQMRKEAEDKIVSYASSNWVDEIKLENYEYVGNYVLSRKDIDGWGDVNRCIVVYKCTADLDFPKEEYKDKAVFYYPVTFYNLMVTPDGTCTVDANNYSAGQNSFRFETTIKSWGSYRSYSFQGFEDISTLREKLVTSVIDDYEYEDNITDTGSVVTNG